MYVYCILESFKTNKSHQVFDYKIASVNSQYKNRNSREDFVIKNLFETICLKNFWYKKKSLDLV